MVLAKAMGNRVMSLEHHGWSVVVEFLGPEGGPGVICLPGMGDIRSVYRHLTEPLVSRGYRVALADLPGLGESEAGPEPSQVDIAHLVVDLAEGLDSPAIVIAHSYTPDSALLASQISPSIVGVLAIGPWATTPELDPFMRAVSRIVSRTPWLWGWFYRSLHKRPPADLKDHVRAIRSSLRRAGGTSTLQRMALGVGKDATDRRKLTTVPVGIVMGSADPDFKDPLAEAEAFAQGLDAAITLAEGCGHYPHTEDPDAVLEAFDMLSRRIDSDTDA